MENKKKLQINCAICDTRNITEEILSAYEAVQINAATLVTSPEAQALLGRYRVCVNTAGTAAISGDARFSLVNGPMTIGASSAVPEEKLYVVVNAPLTIESGCEAVLRSYAGMTVNGPVTCPESMSGLLSAFQINGPIRTYPDGGILLKKTAVLDRFFHLRTKQDALYCAPGRVIALAPDIDFARMAEKNVRFVTKELLVSESYAEAAVAMVDERADITILPDGCAYVDDDAVLDENLVKRYGGKLYIDGSLSITPHSASALDQVSYLRVNGDLLVCRSMKDRVMEMDMAYDRLRVVGGLLISGRVQAEITAGLLADAEDGVSVMDCASVAFAGDVTAELLKEKLVSLSGCAMVICADKEQKSVIEALAEDVASFVLAGEKEEENEDDDAGDENTVKINSTTYAF